MIVSRSLRRHLFRVVAAAVLAVALLVSLRPSAEAASYRNHVASIPATPTSTETVTVWIESDTALGETAGVETLINGVYNNYYGTYDDSNGPDPSNWKVELPAQPNGTTVEYQLFTRNQSSQNYGHTGFNWSYTVDDGDIQWDGLHHDTFDSYFRAPFGAVAAGTDVTLRFQTTPLDVDGVDLRVYTYDPATGSTSGPVDQPMTYLEDQGGYAIWTVTLDTPNTPSILYYHFVITDGLDVDYYSDDHGGPHDNVNQGGSGAASDNQGAEGFQLTVYDPAFQTPDWLQDAVVYQIFPDRFRNGDPSNDYCRAGGTTGCPLFYGDQDVLLREPWNSEIGDPRTPGPYFNEYGTQFYGGDLQGLIDKLDYLKAAGFDTIYTTPIFDGSSNHRYDTDDYMAIDPALGTLADFNELITELEARDMYLIVDGVFNHTSSDSVYFDRYGRYPGNDGACESLSAQTRDWFEFLNNDVPCGTGDYTGWFGYDSLAVLQDGEAEVRDYIYRDTTSVMETWYDRGVAGWRFDVADEISHDWWRDFRPYAKADAPNGPLVGEVWPDASAFLLGDQLDSVMNYRFRKNVLGFVRQAGFEDNDNNGNNEIISLTPSQFDRALKSVREDYPPEATAAMLNLLDSHDTNRLPYLMEIQGETAQQAKERQKLAAVFQYTYLGAPMVYYGDEVAIDSPSLANHVTNGPEDDPYNRAPYPWADEAGDDDTYGPADADMLAFYSRLAELRSDYVTLRGDGFETLLTGDTTGSGADNTTYAYARPGIYDIPIVALNPGSSANTAAVPVAAYYVDGTTLEDMLSGDTYTVSGGEVALTLPARSGVLLLPATTTITVEKVVVGNASGLDDWAFTDPYSGIFNLPAEGGSTVLHVFPYAPLTVSETPVDGWNATAACDNGATGANSVEVTLDDGQDVTCVFTNTQDTSPSGDLTITKVVVGSTPGTDWAFTGDLGPFNLPASGGGATYSDQAVGDYTIDETYVPGWATTTSCTPGSETGDRSVTLTLDADEAAECIFTNTLCQPGYFDDGAACVPADPGYYTDVPGAVAPIACVPGYYQPAQAAVLCIQADAGFYVDTTAATEQMACPLGTTSPAGSDSIDDCVSTTATLTIAKSTDPAGGTGFPFTLDPGAVTFADKWGSNGVGQGQFNGPFGIATDAAGDVYVADTFAYRVQKFDAVGNFILMWGRDVQVGGVTGFEICLASETCKAGTNGSGNGEFNLPHNVAIDGNGNVYVSDSFNHRIQKFDANGNYVGQWGGSGGGGGQFNNPTGLSVDGAGNVYVADSFNSRVQKFDAAGNFLLAWGYNVIDGGGINFEICTPTDTCQAGSSATGNGAFDDPFGVAVYGSSVYVADTFNHRVQVFDTSGNYLDQWGSEGNGNGQFDRPYGLAADAAGNIYVADSNNARMQKFDGDGDYLGQWGYSGTGDGQFYYITGVAVSGAGAYVTDYNFHRVQRFSQTGVTLDDGQSHSFTDLAVGTYLVSELVPAGWTLTDIDCGAATVTESGNTVSVTLSAGDDVTCTFANTQDAPPATADLTITKDTDPAGGTGFPFTLDPAAFTFLTTWGSPGSGSGQFNLPSGVAVDAGGNVYVADHFNYRIQKFSSAGSFLLAWGWDVKVGGVTGFETCGPLDTCKAGTAGAGNGQFNGPFGIAVDLEGNLYVADQYNSRIQKFTTAGVYVTKWGGFGNGQGQFNNPYDVTVDAVGNVFVADSSNHRIQKFNSTGSFLLAWGWDVKVGGVTGFETCGPLDTCKAGTAGAGIGQLNTPAGVTVDGAGNVYIADTENHRIQKFDSNGVFLDQWGSLGSGNGQFNRPFQTVVDYAGNVYVIDHYNHRMQKFNGDGDYLGQSGSPGGGSDQFWYPTDMVVDALGNFFVADQGNQRIQKFGQTSVTLDDDQSHTFIDLLPGTYLVSELVPDGWLLDDITCDGGSPVENGNAVSVTLAGGDDVTCAFSNVAQDTTAPDTTLTGQPTNPSNSANATFDFNSDDANATFECQIDGGGWTPCTSPQSYTGLSEGSHTFQVRATDAAGNTDPTPASYTWVIDTTGPTVTINQAAGQADPTGASPINFTVVFSEPVTGFATGDVTLSGTAGATTAIVTGSGTTYNVAVSGMTNSGTVIATVAASFADDAAGNDNEASTSTDNTVTYNAPDTTPPTVTINQAAGQADPTSDSPINFTVVFSEPVTGFATGDVTLSGTAGATTAIVTGSGTTYNVAVSGMTGSGTVIATVAASVADDAAGNDNEASTSTDNQVTYNVLDTTAPTVTINQASGQADPTSASPINFTVVFSEPVTGFATGDVTLSGTAGATTAVVTGSGTTYNVAVSGMTGSGTVIASVAANKAEDAAGNDNAASTSTDNTVTYNAPDTTPPTVTINQAAGQADPTGSSPINFTVVFSEPVTGFATGDVTLSGTAGATTAVVTGSGTTYNVAVSGMTNDGTVIVAVPANAAVDAAGNDNEASTSTDNTVTYNAPDTTAPTVTINQASGQVDPTSSSPINFTVVFSEPVTGFATGDVTLSGTAGATTAVVTGSGTTYNVAVSGMTGSGTVIASVAANKAEDAAGNDNAASTSTDNTVTYNAPAPTGAIYVTAAGGRVVNGPTYQKNDILKWNGSAWSVWFDGAAAGMLPSADIIAFDVDDDAAGSAWIVIRQAQKLPGVGKMEPQQIAYYNGSTWSRFFDGRDVGLLTTGERINGIEVLPGSASPIGTGCQYYLLISTVAGGGVPVGNSNVNFTGEDVLGFCMTSVGTNTAGTWHVVFEGQAQGLQKNNNLGLSASDDGATLYFTAKKSFTGDGGLVRPSELFSYTGGVFSGPLWRAADHGLNQLVDGIDVVGAIP